MPDSTSLSGLRRSAASAQRAHSSAHGVLLIGHAGAPTAALTASLETSGYRTAGPCSTLPQAIAAITAEAPRLVLVDLRANNASAGVEIARDVWNRFLLMSVVITDRDSRHLLGTTQGAGVVGCLVDPFSDEQLAATLMLASQWSSTARDRSRDRHTRQAFADAYEKIADAVHATDRLIEQISARSTEPEGLALPLSGLSGREAEVLRLLLSNYRVRAIGEALFISPHTVRNHLKAIYRKVGIGSQTELIARMRAQADDD
jgi:DNA-binding NarL/FixJ family response regulator